MWEGSDGAVFLVRELVPFLQDDETVANVLREVVEVMEGSYHFPEGSVLRATVFDCLAKICSGLGTKRFKSIGLEMFLPEIVRTLDGRRRGVDDGINISRLCVSACERCVGELSSLGFSAAST